MATPPPMGGVEQQQSLTGELSGEDVAHSMQQFGNSLRFLRNPNSMNTGVPVNLVVPMNLVV